MLRAPPTFRSTHQLERHAAIIITCDEEEMARRQAFQGDRELQRFVLPRARPTGKRLGVGSYGSVEELEVNGLMCAGKRLHEELLDHGNIGTANITRKYRDECQVITWLPTFGIPQISVVPYIKLAQNCRNKSIPDLVLL